MASYLENQKKVELLLNSCLEILSKHYVVKRLDPGKFARPVTDGIQFNIACYEIEGLGHLMTMTTEDKPDMQLATFTLTPYFKNLPLLSSDFIFNAEKGMFLIEVYELVKNREDKEFQSWMKRFMDKFEEINDFQSIPTKPCFYDPIRPVYVCKARDESKDERGMGSLFDALETYIEMEKSLPLLSSEAAAEKNAICRQYVDDLIDQNGVATEHWVKDHGADYVREYFHNIFFGV